MATETRDAAGYERLGGRKLSLIDVVAQSVGFMGPVFSAAFLIPLIVGVMAVIGILITGGAIFGSIYQVPSPTKLAPYYAVAWFVVGIVLTFVVKGREPARRALDDLHSGAVGD